MKTSNRLISLYLLIGFITSLCLSALYMKGGENLFSYSFIFCFPFLYCLAFNGQNALRLIITSMLASLLVSLPFIGIQWQIPEQVNLQLLSFFVLFPIFFYAVHCFHAVIHQDNSLKLKYTDLFSIVWNSLPMILIAAVFSAAGQGLLSLTAVMFKSIEIYFLYDVIYTPYYFFLSNITLFFVGLAIAELNREVVYNIRFIIFRAVFYLLPCLALMTILYFVLYWIQFLTAKSLSFYPVGILLELTAAGILLINGWFQDGQQPLEYPVLIKKLLDVYRVVLFFISLMLAYEVCRLIDIFPNLLLSLAALILFSFAYAITVFMKEQQGRKKMADFNIYISLLFLLVFFIINNPFYPIHYDQKPILNPKEFIKNNIIDVQVDDAVNISPQENP